MKRYDEGLQNAKAFVDSEMKGMASRRMGRDRWYGDGGFVEVYRMTHRNFTTFTRHPAARRGHLTEGERRRSA